MRKIVLWSLAATILTAPATAQTRPASPDWRINVGLSWSGLPPTRFTLQTSGIGAHDFPTTTQPVRIDHPVGNLADDHLLIVHFPTASHAFALRARDREPDFNLRLTLPNGLQCDNPVVSRIAQDAQSGDAERVASAGMAASYLLELQTNVCGPGNKDRLREAVVNSHCRLAEITTLFSVPDVPWRNFAQRVAECRRNSRVRIVSEQFREASRQVGTNRFEELDTSLARLRAYSASWSDEFAAARLEPDLIRHMEIQGLYERAVPLRDEGRLQDAEPYAARLATLARNPEYRQAFRRADLAPADAIDIFEGIRQSLAPQNLIQEPGLTNPAGPRG
jgi:hypothetical protein